MTRVLVCGGRQFRDVPLLRERLDLLVGDITLVHGDATGADRLASAYAKERGWRVEAHPADWDRYGPKAGYLRNREMIDSGPDLVIACPGGKGTEMTVRMARQAGIRVERLSASTTTGGS